MVRLRSTALLAAAGLLAAMLGACGTAGGQSSSSGQGQVKNGGHLTVALGEAPDTLDPTLAQTYVGRIVLLNMCQKLYDINSQLKIVPELATSLPTITGGGTVYTIHLRSGVKFNDGTAFDAAAVKTTLERDLTDKRSSRASSLKAIKDVTAVDATTVRITLSQPFAPVLAVLAARAGMIESPAQIAKLGDKFGTHPVCVGPFEFVSRPSADQINLKKSTYYYDAKDVHLDTVTFEVVTEPNVRQQNLLSGTVDLANALTPPVVQALKNVSGVKLDSVTSLGYQGITVNVSNAHGAGKAPYTVVSTALAAHPDLRKAFELSISRDELNKVVFDGQYVPDCSPISPDSPYASNFHCTTQDLAEAKKLVAASGLPTPIPVTLMIEAGNSQVTKLGTVIQSMADKAGFKVTLNPTEFTTSLTEARAGKFDTFQIGWSGRVDPDQNIAPFWTPGSLLNYSGADYPDVASLIDQARSTTDQSKRKQIYAELVQKFNQDLNIIYLYHPKDVLGYRSNVVGVQYFNDGLIRLWHAGLTSQA